MKTGRILALSIVLAALMLAGAPRLASAHDPDAEPVTHSRPEHGSLGEIGAKLSDPTSNIWALSFNFQGPTFYDGDLNSGKPRRSAGT